MAAVCHSVVTSTQGCQVVEVGRAFGVSGDVVEVAPSRRGFAAGEHASAVSYSRGASLRWGGESEGGSEVEGDTDDVHRLHKVKT